MVQTNRKREPQKHTRRKNTRRKDTRRKDTRRKNTRRKHILRESSIDSENRRVKKRKITKRKITKRSRSREKMVGGVVGGILGLGASTAGAVAKKIGKKANDYVNKHGITKEEREIVANLRKMLFSKLKDQVIKNSKGVPLSELELNQVLEAFILPVLSKIREGKVEIKSDSIKDEFKNELGILATNNEWAEFNIKENQSTIEQAIDDLVISEDIIEDMKNMVEEKRTFGKTGALLTSVFKNTDKKLLCRNIANSLEDLGTITSGIREQKTFPKRVEELAEYLNDDEFTIEERMELIKDLKKRLEKVSNNKELKLALGSISFLVKILMNGSHGIPVDDKFDITSEELKDIFEDRKNSSVTASAPAVAPATKSAVLTVQGQPVDTSIQQAQPVSYLGEQQLDQHQQQPLGFNEEKLNALVEAKVQEALKKSN